ncbi:MAG: hypothetical protein RJA25_1917 [Bacteroidota bacterium]|jgi:hypothetical protein
MSDSNFQPNDHEIEIKETAIKFGVIGGLIGILVSLILFYTNLQFESWSKWIQSVVMVASIVLGVKLIADANKGKLIPFGILFKGGMLVTLVLTFISITFFFIYVHFIDTDFINGILDVSRQKMTQNGLGDDQIDKAIEISKKFLSPGIMAIISTISSLIIGAIVSSISAAVFKKEK